MSDYDDWDGNVTESIRDNCHASHKPLPEQESEAISKEEKARLILLLRDSVGIEKAKPARSDTTALEAELKLKGKV